MIILINDSELSPLFFTQKLTLSADNYLFSLKYQTLSLVSYVHSNQSSRDTLCSQSLLLFKSFIFSLHSHISNHNSIFIISFHKRKHLPKCQSDQSSIKMILMKLTQKNQQVIKIKK